VPQAKKTITDRTLASVPANIRTQAGDAAMIMSMLVVGARHHGGTWIFYVIAQLALCGAVACFWWIIRGAIALFGKTSR
jgi:hypothetical protein